jgi:Fe-S-cluster containining protein
LHSRFDQILAAGRGHPALIDAVTTEAFDLFERNVATHTEGLQVLACHKGCPACCCLRVTATAPEVFQLAAYVRRIHEKPTGAQLDLPGRIAEANATASGLDAQSRMQAQCFCPLILNGSCIIHPIRPLACRGHASFDKQGCMDAAAGRPVEVPLSEPHAIIRSLVQNALQSALRAQGYAWRSYELIHALHLALTNGHSAGAWSQGEDTLAAALVEETDWEALATMFDEAISTPTPA